AIILLSKNGVENMIKLGQKMGISTWEDSNRYGLALTLGGAEVKMTDMAVVYGTLANGGITVPLNPILKVLNYNGQEIKYSVPIAHYSIRPETASTISEILSDNQARSPAFGFNSILNLKDYVAAVKTGTSNDLRDNWTFGYTHNFVVGSWVGNNDNSPMSNIVSGITGASPIWARIMKNLLSQNPTPKIRTLSAFPN
ncbi:penicillin-binding protein, partial [Candidatus Collierbacteria bacterium]|nr:penicillin-binding protein [Candidatus Collierbacteria bacterium]